MAKNNAPSNIFGYGSNDNRRYYTRASRREHIKARTSPLTRLPTELIGRIAFYLSDNIPLNTDAQARLRLHTPLNNYRLTSRETKEGAQHQFLARGLNNLVLSLIPDHPDPAVHSIGAAIAVVDKYQCGKRVRTLILSDRRCKDVRAPALTPAQKLAVEKSLKLLLRKLVNLKSVWVRGPGNHGCGGRHNRTQRNQVVNIALQCLTAEETRLPFLNYIELHHGDYTRSQLATFFTRYARQIQSLQISTAFLHRSSWEGFSQTFRDDIPRLNRLELHQLYPLEAAGPGMDYVNFPAPSGTSEVKLLRNAKSGRNETYKLSGSGVDASGAHACRIALNRVLAIRGSGLWDPTLTNEALNAT